MARKVRIVAEALPTDYTLRFGVPDGNRGRGRTLADYRRMFGGGLAGTVHSPVGPPQQISLAAFEQLPSDTYVDLRFIVADPGMDLPPEYSDGIVLKEFDAP